MNTSSPEQDVAVAPSPLTGTSAGVVVARHLDLSQLIEGYRRRHGVDVASLFAGTTELRLLHDQVTGLSFFDPPVVGDAAFYATMARRPGYHRADKAEFRIAAGYIPAGARVLEVGAGAGHFTTHLRNADYLGLEFNAEAVASAKVLGIPIVERDVCDIAAEIPESFDCTCAFQVLEHVADPLRMIAAMVELTRPGGKIIISTPNAGSYITRCRDLLNAPPHHVTWWEDRTWQWIACTFGLTDLRLHHTPIDEMIGAWAHMLASDGIARQLGFVIDPVVDETPLRQRIDLLAEPVARTIRAGITNRADAPEAGHTTVAIFTKQAGTDSGNP
jgi:SAM-dependent methyltransferase